MKIFSATGIVFPGIGPPTDDPPPLISKSGLDLITQFEAFAVFVDKYAKASETLAIDRLGTTVAAKRQNLPRAMYANFILPVLNEIETADNLYDVIISAYSKLKLLGDKENIFKFCLHLFVTLFHFSIWYCREVDSTEDIKPSNDERYRILSSNIRKYLKSALDSVHFANGTKIKDGFYDSLPFQYGCLINGSLETMLGVRFDPEAEPVESPAFGDLTRGGPGGYANLTGGSRARPIDADTASKVKREFVKTFRSTVRDIVVSDVRRFLAVLSTKPGGAALTDMFGSFRQYCLGDGTGTTSMFDRHDYGLIFFDYELDDLDDIANLTKRKVYDIPLMDSTDGQDASASFIYYGLDHDYLKNKETITPFVKLWGYEGTTGRIIKGEVLTANDPSDHRLVRGDGLAADNIRLGDGGAKLTSIRCDLSSALMPKRHEDDADDWEELIFIVFKHNIPDPRKPPPQGQIFLSAERCHEDNEFQQFLVPATGQAPAKIRPPDFNEPAADLDALAAALVAHPGFSFTARLDGLGIGSPADPDPPVDKKEHRLVRAAGQNDRPPAGGYEALRYAHGWMEWTPTGGFPWLYCHVAGFVSPLRCTWAEKLPADKKALLETYVDANVTQDWQKRPTYNCVLSGFRAFGLFHAMVDALLDAIDRLNSPSGAAAKKTLNDYLTKEAVVTVTLPTGMPWKGPQLDYKIISQFY